MKLSLSIAFFLCFLLLPFATVRSDTQSIYSLVASDQVLEIADTRQVSGQSEGEAIRVHISPNGKYMVYTTMAPDADSTQRVKRLYLTRVTGTKPVLLLEGDGEDSDPTNNHEWEINETTIIWSPDSKYVALQCSRNYQDESQPEKQTRSESCYMVFNTNAQTQSSFHFPTDTFFIDTVWSPDSRKFAAVTLGKRDPETNQRISDLFLFDVTSGQSQVVYTHSGRWCNIERWEDRGKALLCVEPQKGESRYIKVFLDGRPLEEYEGLTKEYRATDDGTLRYTRLGKKGLAIEDIATGKVVCKIEDAPWGLYQWLPNSRLLSYFREYSIDDGTDGKSSKINSLWIAYPWGGKYGRMCAALDVESFPSWSDDCRRMAYVSRGKVFVSSLQWRPTTLRERALAGAELNEEEIKALMLDNGKQIADALQRCINGAEYFPAEEDALDVITRYLRFKDAIFIPGTEKVSLTYIRPDNPYPSKIESAAETVVAVLNAGYDWRVYVYADLHTQLIK